MAQENGNKMDPAAEKGMLLAAKMTCPVCDTKFTTLRVKSSRLRRLDSDPDLRPNYQGIDILKYDVTKCECCGYASLNKYFEPISVSQRKWLKDGKCDNYEPSGEPPAEMFDFNQAVVRHKEVIECDEIKHAPLSQKAMAQIHISWLRRRQMEEMEDKTSAFYQGLKQEHDKYYRMAYENFERALSEENPPYAGLDDRTMDYLLCNMAVYFKDYGKASKLVSDLITNPATPGRMKEKCRDLKDVIVAEVKKLKEAEG